MFMYIYTPSGSTKFLLPINNIPNILERRLVDSTVQIMAGGKKVSYNILFENVNNTEL